MEWAAKGSHLGGIPRKIVISAVGAFAKLVTSFLNSTHVHNVETLLRLIKSRPPSTPLITVSNHMSTLDDPLMWGFKGCPITDLKLCRWTLAAEDICFTNHVFTYFFRLGKVSQMNGPIQRLKWGTASLIVRASVTPIVLPIAHSGFEKIMPEKHWFGRRPLFPLCLKNINIVVGEPMEFDLQRLRERAKSASRSLGSSGVINDECSKGNRSHHCNSGWPMGSCQGLDESAQKWLFAYISDHIQRVMQKLCAKARFLNGMSG